MTTSLTKKQIIEKLIDLCAYISACAKADTEAILAGNGTNAFEAYNVVVEIFKIIGEPENFEELTYAMVKKYDLEDFI